MANTVNYPLRTSPEIRAAASALVKLDEPRDRDLSSKDKTTYCVLPHHSINEVFNSLIETGLRRVLATTEWELHGHKQILEVTQTIMRFMLDNPDAAAMHPYNTAPGTVTHDVLSYLEWFQLKTGDNENAWLRMPEEVYYLLEDYEECISGDPEIGVDRWSATQLLELAQHKVRQMTEAVTALQAAVTPEPDWRSLNAQLEARKA